MIRLFIIIYVSVFIPAGCFAKSVADSTRSYSFTITPRLNSAGYFPFTGALLNHNTNFDMNMIYQNKAFGFLAFKSVDLQDVKTPINYLQTALFKPISLSRSVTISLYAGYLFSQTQAFRDKTDSDYFAAFSTYWNVNEHLRIENIALLNDVSTQSKIINRLLILYTLRNFRLDLSIHERYVFETMNSSTSAALAVNFPRIILTKKLSALSTITYQSYVTPKRPDFALRNGFLFSLSFPVNLSRP